MPHGHSSQRRGLLIADVQGLRLHRLDLETGIITIFAGNDAIYGYYADGGPTRRSPGESPRRRLA